MERISKKEYYAKYANKQDKLNIQMAAILTYICGGISLISGLFAQNYYMIIDVVLIVGLALGLHIARSRVCAVLILIYSCLSSILALINTGRVTGWWLILVGVWAVRGTINFHKDYQRYLSETSSDTSERQL